MVIGTVSLIYNGKLTRAVVVESDFLGFTTIEADTLIIRTAQDKRFWKKVFEESKTPIVVTYRDAEDKDACIVFYGGTVKTIDIEDTARLNAKKLNVPCIEFGVARACTVEVDGKFARVKVGDKTYKFECIETVCPEIIRMINIWHGRNGNIFCELRQINGDMILINGATEYEEER